MYEKLCLVVLITKLAVSTELTRHPHVRASTELARPGTINPRASLAMSCALCENLQIES